MSVVYSKRGKPIDFTELAETNGDMIAAGNANLNARGDKLGRGNKVVETAESMKKKYEAMQAYAQPNNGVKQTSVAGRIIPDDVKILTPQEAMNKTRRAQAAERKAQAELLNTPISNEENGPSAPVDVAEPVEMEDAFSDPMEATEEVATEATEEKDEKPTRRRSVKKV